LDFCRLEGSNQQIIGTKVEYFRPKRLVRQPVSDNQLRTVPESYQVVEDVLPTASIRQPGVGNDNTARTGLHSRIQTWKILDGVDIPFGESEDRPKTCLVLL